MFLPAQNVQQSPVPVSMHFKTRTTLVIAMIDSRIAYTFLLSAHEIHDLPGRPLLGLLGVLGVRGTARRAQKSLRYTKSSAVNMGLGCDKASWSVIA